MRLLLPLLLLPLPALAQGGVDCANTSIQAELNTCAALDYEAADAELNAAYAAAMEVARSYDGQQEALLRDAQRAWIAFRDAACSAEASLVEGGSMQPMVGSGCLARVTRERTEDLRSYAEVGGY